MAFVRRRVAGTSSSTKPAKRVEADFFSGNTTVLEPSAQDSLFNTAASPGGDYPPPPNTHVQRVEGQIGKRQETATTSKPGSKPSAILGCASEHEGPRSARRRAQERKDEYCICYR